MNISHLNSYILDFVSKLDYAENFDECFVILTEAAQKLGFDGVLYSYMPVFFTEKSLDFQPIMQVSPGFGVDYLQHYQEKNFVEYDHMVQAGRNGEEKRVYNWFEDVKAIPLKGKPLQVLETAREFGIRNGLTIPTLITPTKMAAASFICRQDDKFFNAHCVPNTELLNTLAHLFHHKVVSEQHYKKVFILPFLNKLSHTKLKVLQKLSQGKNIQSIAAELNNTEKYTQNLIGKIRKDFGGVPRDRLLYLAGILDIEELRLSK